MIPPELKDWVQQALGCLLDDVDDLELGQRFIAWQLEGIDQVQADRDLVTELGGHMRKNMANSAVVEAMVEATLLVDVVPADDVHPAIISGLLDMRFGIPSADELVREGRKVDPADGCSQKCGCGTPRCDNCGARWGDD